MLSTKRRNLIFIEAAILTIIIYLLALILNGYLDTQRIETLDYEFINSSTIAYNLKVFNAFNKNINNSNCLIKKKLIFNSFKSIKKVGKDLSNYGKLFLSENEKISKLKQRQYFLNELDLYLEINEFNILCQDNKIMPIIYFFNSNNLDLDKQSLNLEQFYLNHINDTMIFSFDINYIDEPILEEIKLNKNIIFTPFIIINNKTTNNLVNKDKVVNINTLTLEFKKYFGVENGN